jgi:hypothetical protein
MRIITRALLVAMTLLTLYMAPLCLLAAAGGEDPYAQVVSFRAELILVLAGIMTLWWGAFMLAWKFRRPKTARRPRVGVQ